MEFEIRKRSEKDVQGDPGECCVCGSKPATGWLIGEAPGYRPSVKVCGNMDCCGENGRQKLEEELARLKAPKTAPLPRPVATSP